MALTEPTAIDPYRAQEVEGVLVTKALYSGLLGLDGRGGLVPALATDRHCSEDGRRWTFRLRRDACFSDGEPIDARSFVRGWNRAADPAAGSETTYHLAGIRGYHEMQAGQVTTLPGVTATDGHTLAVELGAPDFEFDKKVLQPVFSPVPAGTPGAQDPAFNDQPIGNGPFKLAEPWRHHESIHLVRNERYFGPPAALDEVAITILAPADAVEREYEGFERGEFDFARIPPGRLSEARQRYGQGFIEQELAGVNYLLPFLGHPPLNRLEARQAVSYAIDRRAIIRAVFEGHRTLASSLVPPAFPEAYQPGLAASCLGPDPRRARELARRAGLVPGTVLPLAYNTGAGHDAWVQAVADDLRRVLGLDVRVEAMTPRQLVEYRTSPGASGLCRAAWACDYPTPDNVLFPLLHSSCTRPDERGVAHGDNEGRYANPRFDRLVERARATRDERERVTLVRAAESVAIGEDLAIIPLWYRTHHRVFDARRCRGLALDFYGNPTLAAVRSPAPAPTAS